MTSTAVAKPSDNPRALFLKQVDQRADVWRATLPPGVSLDRFKTVVLTAVLNDQNLMFADRQSLFQACATAAKDGLLPDKREAALVCYKNRVTYIPMYQGLLKRARSSGDIASVRTHVVYEGDEFSVIYGDEEKIVHVPNMTDRGENIVAAYCIVHLHGGEVVREVMTRADIEKVKAKSMARGSGPWVDWFEEMARKTVFRRASKWLPWSREMAGDDDDAPQVTIDGFADQLSPEPETDDDPDIRALMGERMAENAEHGD